MLLLASCGRQHDAEKTVAAFVEANAEAPDRMTDRSYTKLSMTPLISDSLISVMRHRGAPLFKKVIRYPEAQADTLYYLRMRFIHQGDTLHNTFYLNKELTAVMAFK